MAETLTIRTASSTEVVKIAVPGPQGPKGDKGDPGDVAGLPLTTQGDTLYRGASENQRLPIGTTGQVLKVSAGGIPTWANESGTVTSVALASSDLTITGSPITTSGTITANLSNSGATAGTYTKVTVDAKGRVTAGFTATPSDIDAAESNHDHQPADIYCDAVKVTATTQSAGEPNGVYFRDGSDNGKATYKSGAGYLLWWDSDDGEWVIGNTAQSQKYFIGSQDTTYPWQVSTAWTLGAQGSGTVPAVGQATLTDYQLNAAQDSVSTRAPKSGNATSTEVVLGSDTRLTNSRTPTAHAASHAAGGSDHLELADLAATGSSEGSLLVGDGGGAVAWLDGQTWASQNINAQDIGAAFDSHTHGNLTNDGKVGSTSGLPLVTTTAGAVTTLALGTAGQVLTVNSGANGVEFAAAAGGVADGDKGDITVSNSGATWTIDANAVTNADLAQVATATLKGRSTAGTGNVEDLSASDARTVLGLATNSAVTFASLATSPAANASALTTTGYSLTGSNAQSLVDLAGTWNTTGTPSAIKLNVTNTASNASSLLLQLQTGGTNRFTVNASGDVSCGKIASGGTASGTQAVVSGGTGNTASGFQSTIIGGRNNIASSDRAIAGGDSCSANTGSNALAIGSSNNASGTASCALGEATVASSARGMSVGLSSRADRLALFAHAAGTFAANGDAQRIRAVLRCKTTTNAAVEMALDGSTTYLTIPSGKVIYAEIRIVGSKSDGTAVACYTRQYAAKNVAGTSSEVFAPVTIGTDNAAGTSLEVATVDAGDYIRIRPTGITSETWRWVASVDAVEVAYGT